METSYNEKEVVRSPMRPSPSPLCNNLAQAAGFVVYAHKCSPCVLSPLSISQGVQAAVRRVDTECEDLIYMVMSCLVGGGTWYVVLGTDAGLQVWDQGCSNLLSKWNFPEDEPGPVSHHTSNTALFVRGAAAVVTRDGSPALCWGSSRGKLYLAQLLEDGQLGPASSFTNHIAPITCIGSAYQTSRGQPADFKNPHNLVSCDQEGLITLWDAVSTSNLSLANTISQSSEPVVSVALRRNYMIVARLEGCFQVYDMASCSLVGEVVSHSRFLTAMDMHPCKDIIATTSEDATVNVWTLPLGNGIKGSTNLLSALWPNAMPTGIAFCGPSDCDIAVVALDNEELRVFRAGA
ncbi:hypothetical protein CEUSTIGMA_g7675.t1 [Chlamydomonas eustigma]|uniref:WD repeat-containing protein 54 beta-propeller domain-containing protein n=1 Tax=Chlamydomonas eustigma TaxID=1157962 RepID=A0A250XAY4_9CHLO|nr:hypothetical protein CEUSTIGMA_g7675.t1 [Chlamydomonas eustigma]|eukprot:GAX80237.1 hypothetical protein CEUSTIGMA_g7675.t1 [Chlamydomonas eustigma]